MDQFMVDLTGIPEAKEGDLVTLIGRDGEEEITMEEIAEVSGGFHYEIPCLIGKRVPRVYVKNGKVLGIMNCRMRVCRILTGTPPRFLNKIS